MDNFLHIVKAGAKTAWFKPATIDFVKPVSVCTIGFFPLHLVQWFETNMAVLRKILKILSFRHLSQLHVREYTSISLKPQSHPELPGPEVQIHTAQNLGHGKGKIPLWPTTNSGSVNRSPLVVSVKLSELSAVFSWPQ